MARKTREMLLEELRLSKTGRRVEHVEKILKLFGFTCRKVTKERALWKKGRHQVTLPQPKGVEKALKVAYVSQVVRLIDESEIEAGPR